MKGFIFAILSLALTVALVKASPAPSTIDQSPLLVDYYKRVCGTIEKEHTSDTWSSLSSVVESSYNWLVKTICPFTIMLKHYDEK